MGQKWRQNKKFFAIFLVQNYVILRETEKMDTKNMSLELRGTSPVAQGTLQCRGRGFGAWSGN